MYEALRIIHHVNEYVKPFKEGRREDLISLLVRLKYFELSKQLSGTIGFREPGEPR